MAADAQKEELRGNQRYNSGSSGYNAIYFMIERFLKDRVNTALPVRVIEVFPREEQPEQPEQEAQEPVTPDDGGEEQDRFPQPEMVGFLSAIPLICSYQAGVGGTKKRLEPTIIPKMPYFRLQGGLAAVVNDPQPGDIGIAIFAQQDISRLFGLETSGEGGDEGGGSDLPPEPGVQEDDGTQQPVLPGSFRTFDMSDGVYIGGILNKAPVAWIEFKQQGEGTPAEGEEEADPLITINIKSTENLEFKAVEEFYVEAKNVTFKTEELFKVEAKNIEMTAEENVTLKAEKSLSLESGEDMKLTAGTEMNIKATDGLNIEAEIVDIKADKVKMSGDLEVAGKVKAAEVEGDTVKQGNIQLGTHKHGNGNNGNNTTGPIT